MLKHLKNFVMTCLIFTFSLFSLTSVAMTHFDQTKTDLSANMKFSGRAIGVNATLIGSSFLISDTGNLPTTGGALEASLLTTSLSVLTADVLHSTTIGKENTSRSEASTASVNINLPGLSVGTGLLMARSQASCVNNRPVVSGNATVLNLIVNGKAINITGTPNQTINLIVGKIIINEQIKTNNAMTVNALHVIVNGVADIIVASAHADITCGKSTCTSNDFITGGGFIDGPSGGKANFGIAGGIKNQGLWGHLVYIDHSGNMKIKGITITSYQIIGSTQRRITGTAEVNGQPGFNYTVDVADNGEPGNTDTFSITLTPQNYHASGVLSGGNIQLHGRCRK